MAEKEIKKKEKAKKKPEKKKIEKELKQVKKTKTVQVNDDSKEVKIEKKKRFWDEIKAFLILAIIIIVVIVGGWYWYTHIYTEDKKPAVKEEKIVDQYQAFKYTVADSHNLDVLNNKYLIEYDDHYIYKVLDMKTNVLFDGEEEYSYYIEGEDGAFYLIKNDEAENENIVTISKLDDKKFKEEKQLMESAVYYIPIIYEDENGHYITLGFSGTKYSYDEEMNEKNTTYVYNLNGKEYELINYQFVGDKKLTEPFEAIITYDKENIIVGTSETYANMRYGLLDLANGNTIINPQYDGLYTDGDNYIAIKNNKAGVITEKLKKIVNFEYDFIAKYDGYYVVSKNNKMAIMNNEYDLITEYDFDYQSKTDGSLYSYTDWNTIDSYRVNDKYVLITNNRELEDNIKYENSITYIIDKNGQSKSVQANKFSVNKEDGLIYAYDNINRNVSIYDSNLDEMYKISLNNYDFAGIPEISLINGNTIEIKLDSSIYFDYEDGHEIEDIKDFSLLINGITVNYDKQNKEMIYSSSSKEIARINIDVSEDSNNYFIELNDKAFYYSTTEQYLYIEKID